MVLEVARDCVERPEERAARGAVERAGCFATWTSRLACSKSESIEVLASSRSGQQRRRQRAFLDRGRQDATQLEVGLDAAGGIEVRAAGAVVRHQPIALLDEERGQLEVRVDLASGLSQDCDAGSRRPGSPPSSTR